MRASFCLCLLFFSFYTNAQNVLNAHQIDEKCWPYNNKLSAFVSEKFPDAKFNIVLSDSTLDIDANGNIEIKKSENPSQKDTIAFRLDIAKYVKSDFNFYTTETRSIRAFNEIIEPDFTKNLKSSLAFIEACFQNQDIVVFADDDFENQLTKSEAIDIWDTYKPNARLVLKEDFYIQNDSMKIKTIGFKIYWKINVDQKQYDSDPFYQEYYGSYEAFIADSSRQLVFYYPNLKLAIGNQTLVVGEKKMSFNEAFEGRMLKRKTISTINFPAAENDFMNHLTVFYDIFKIHDDLKINQIPKAKLNVVIDDGRKIIGAVQKGKAKGKWKIMFPNNQTALQFAYNSKGLKGKVEAFYENGQLRYSAHFKNGKLEGEQVHYYPSGKLKSTINYLNGMENGLQKYFYENGELYVGVDYKDGIPEGKYVQLNENGRIFCKGEFKNGLMSSNWELNIYLSQLENFLLRNSELVVNKRVWPILQDGIINANATFEVKKAANAKFENQMKNPSIK